jgi:hypothetical protein
MRQLDFLLQAFGQVGDALFELLDGVLELLDLRLDVTEKLENELRQLVGRLQRSGCPRR